MDKVWRVNAMRLYQDLEPFDVPIAIRSGQLAILPAADFDAITQAIAGAKAKQESTYQSLVRARAQTEACEEKIESLTASCHSFDLQVRELEAENTRLRAELAEARQDCQRLDTAFNNLRAERNRPAEFWKNTNPRQG
jgi:chromosome segregation ATPase